MKRFFRRIKRVIDWMPVLWDLYEWGYDGLYLVMAQHLDGMESVIRNGRSVDAAKTADQISYAIGLLNRLIADDFLEIATEPLHEKWGDGEMQWRDFDGDSPFDDDDLVEYIGVKYPNAETEEDQLRAEAEFRVAYKEADETQDMTRKELFKHIGICLPGWWD